MVLGTASVQSLQCYFCQSAVSIEECSSRQFKITCPSDLEEPLCAEVKIKAITNGGKETYVYTRDCTTKRFCAEANSCGMNCNLKCCSDDSCNGGGDGKGSSERLDGRRFFRLNDLLEGKSR
ncbi:hypothetical protein ABFA07_021765 [Porites harrisoni]